jgi:hypothetical protein
MSEIWRRAAERSQEFDTEAVAYDRYRPPYPEQIFADIVECRSLFGNAPLSMCTDPPGCGVELADGDVPSCRPLIPKLTAISAGREVVVRANRIANQAVGHN